MGLGAHEMRALYDQTVVVRQPRFGIVSGYHELPYICLAAGIESGAACTRVKGAVHVSPRFVITPPHLGPSYEDIFGSENVDMELTGRIFGFLGFGDRPIECQSEYLEVKHLDKSIDRVVSETLDDLERFEDITTGVIIAPDARYYPVSIERFIASVLEDEFSV